MFYAVWRLDLYPGIRCVSSMPVGPVEGSRLRRFLFKADLTRASLVQEERTKGQLLTGYLFCLHQLTVFCMGLLVQLNMGGWETNFVSSQLYFKKTFSLFTEYSSGGEEL